MGTLQPGQNCWRIERANRARVIVDAADYFATIRQAMLNAKHRIFLIAWDFDTRIKLSNGRKKRGEPPAELGAFILWLADRTPGLEIKILIWNLGALKILGRGSSIITAARWALHNQIKFKFDSAHPPACSHHQKIVVIDDSFAVCGGIDITSDRWDTCDHIDDDPRRKGPNGKVYEPWHDTTMVVDGPAASALAALGRARWRNANDEELAPCEPGSDPWPDELEPQFREVDIAIARTVARHGDLEEVREIEKLYLDQIAAAKHFIYAENQYFASPKIADAIAKRLCEPHPPEIILVNPLSAHGWLEQVAMDSARSQLVRSIGAQAPKGQFVIYTPETAAGGPIYVHAKLMIIDDQVLRIGSSNMNNRSLGLDSECDLIIDCSDIQNDPACAAIRRLRLGLLAEHCGLAIEDVERVLDRNPAMTALIDAQTGVGRKLVRLALPDLGAAEQFVADNELMDPESAEELFEPFAKRGLFRQRKKLGAP